MNREDCGSYKLDKKLYKTIIKDIKKKNKGMFKLFNNAGSKYRKAIYHYMNRIIRDEETPTAFPLTWLIAIWKKKGSALDLNQMRYIHNKLWDAKLCEALITRNMKGKIVKACPNIQIGGMPNSSSVEHLVTLKTLMRILEERIRNYQDLRYGKILRQREPYRHYVHTKQKSRNK
jgi:hypothetical protein